MLTTLFIVGRAPETRQAGDNTVTEIALGYNYGKRDPSTNKQPTQWIKASMWGKRGEAIAPHLAKGNQVVATLSELHIKSREYQGKTYNDLVARVEDIKLIRGQQKREEPVQKPKPAQVPAEHFDDDDIPL